MPLTMEARFSSSLITRQSGIRRSRHWRVAAAGYPWPVPGDPPSEDRFGRPGGVRAHHADHRRGSPPAAGLLRGQGRHAAEPRLRAVVAAGAGAGISLGACCSVNRRPALALNRRASCMPVCAESSRAAVVSSRPRKLTSRLFASRARWPWRFGHALFHQRVSTLPQRFAHLLAADLPVDCRRIPTAMVDARLYCLRLPRWPRREACSVPRDSKRPESRHLATTICPETNVMGHTHSSSNQIIL